MADDITILLQARDKASAVIAGVEKRMDVLTGKYTQALNAVEIGASVAIVTNAFTGLGKVIDGIRKNGIDGLADGIREIPLFGPLVKSADNLIGAISGANAELERLKELLEENNRVDKARIAALDATKKIQRELELREKIATAADATEKTILQMIDKETTQVEQINKLLDSRDIAASQRAQLERQRDELYRISTIEINNLLGERIAAEAKARVDKEESLRKEMQAEADKAFRASQTIADLDSQIAATRLRLLGQDEQAEIESIKRRYEARIAEAKRANETEKADRLKTLMDLDLAQAASKRKGPGGPDRIQDLRGTEQRFLTRAPGLGNDPAAKAAQATAKNTQATATKLDAIQKALEANARKPGIELIEGRL